jgi:hypothetical protein
MKIFLAGATGALGRRLVPLAVERGGPGVYNIADDEPAPVAVWLPELAKILRAKPPRRIPAWLGRLAAGEPVSRCSPRSAAP